MLQQHALFTWLALATSSLAQTTGREVVPGNEGAGRDVVHYDYVENGELRGGTVPVDPANPLLADVPSALPESTSNWVTLLDNGPPANRIDLVFVGDGYTAAELGSYADHVDSIYPSFLAEPPLADYSTYFNVHRVDVVSVESGIDNDPVQGILRNTALDMEYWCGGTQRLLCVNVNKARNEADAAPDRDQVLAVANSSTYGGAGYNNLGTLAGSNGSTVELALHEFGHSFPDLADEYTYGGPTTYTGPEPNEKNVSRSDEAALIALQRKWYRWLDLPHISAFEGGRYSVFGIYRPTDNSKMRNLGRPYEEVNAERFIAEIYKAVDPIDDATPAGVYDTTQLFSVTPMQPVNHSLDVQWLLDGFPIPGAVTNTLAPSTLNLPAGIYNLEVQVVDNTDQVRDDNVRSLRMSSVRSWAVVSAGKHRPAPSVTGTVAR